MRDLAAHFASVIVRSSLACFAFAPLAACTHDTSFVPQIAPLAADGGTHEGTCAPVRASSETVRVENEYGTLEGTLDVPDGCGPMPVVLVLSGSGTTDRDGNVPSSTSQRPSIYRVLAETVRDEGFAVLRYDDPGIAGSERAVPRRVEDFLFDMEIADAARFVAKLRHDVRFGAVVVAGHSQGSLTGIMAAKAAPIDGLISLAGAGRNVAEVLRDQVAPKLDAAGLVAFDDAVAKLTRGELVTDLAPPLDTVLPIDVQPYMMSWMKLDPRAEIAKLDAPVLILQGEMDLQVTTLDAERLHEGRPDAELTLVRDMGHMLRKVTQKTAAAQRDSYAKPLPLHPDAVAAMRAFLERMRLRASSTGR